MYSSERNVQMLLSLLKAHKIKKMVLSPGSANASFVASAQYDGEFELYSSVDERSAAYIACGLAEESQEPVVICCTGATASRNYMPGLTEAYYRKLPVIAVTATRPIAWVGQNRDQLIDRTVIPKDIAVKYTDNNTPTATFTLAVPRSYKGANGERQTDFIRCVIWNKPAEILQQYATKGSRIGVDGEVRVRSYEDENQKIIYITEILVRQFMFLDSKKYQNEDSEPFVDGQEIPIDDENLPF